MSAILKNVASAAQDRLPNPALADFVPRIVNGVLELPVYYMRGGTSTGIVLWHAHLPRDAALREEAIRSMMGVPTAGEVRAISRRRVWVADRRPATRCSSSSARRMTTPTF